jgi:hypothetical protein
VFIHRSSGGVGADQVASRADRDVRLDVMRGLALLIIFVTHIPGLTFAVFTPRSFGLADAAEAFVFIAGVAAFFAYAPRFANEGVLRGSLPIVTRIWQLYVTHLAIVLVVAGILAWAVQRSGDPEYLESMALDVLLSDTSAAVLGLVTLTFQPNFLDILPLYIVLLAMLPLVLLALRVHWIPVLAASFAVYVLVQFTSINLPNMQASRAWFFNPFAWQFLFVCGIVAAHLSREGTWPAVFARRRLVGGLTALAFGYVLFTFAVAAPWRQIPSLANIELIDAALLPVADKTNLAPLRLLDALAKAWLVAVLVSPSARWLSALPGRALALAGRHSLPVFVLGLILSMAGWVIVREAGFEMAVQAAVVFGGFALLLGFAAFLEWQAQALRRPVVKQQAESGAPLSPTGALVEPPRN